MPRKFPILTTIAFLALPVTGSPLSAAADESGFLKRFNGSWSGRGMVQRNAESEPWKVDCKVVGQPSSDRISIAGSCRAAVIVNRQIGADLTYDPASNRYTGTYVGSKVGPARLSGRRNGDRVDLTITWPRPVNGDTKAKMTIVNKGNGNLQITVADNLRPGGPVQRTSDIALSK